MTTANWPTTEPVGALLTAEEFESLPENPRRELVDGVIHLMPAASPRHQWVKDQLCAALSQLQPGHLVTHTEGCVRLGPLHYRTPDIVVVTADAFARNAGSYLPPEEVLLAVEVVDPGTQQQDRDTKPNEYAKAAIPNFWRVETDPAVTIITSLLTKAGIYVVAGSHSTGVVHPPTLPWANVDVSSLIL
jgi:Uma2 family endonuclease